MTTIQFLEFLQFCCALGSLGLSFTRLVRSPVSLAPKFLNVCLCASVSTVYACTDREPDAVWWLLFAIMWSAAIVSHAVRVEEFGG